MKSNNINYRVKLLKTIELVNKNKFQSSELKGLLSQIRQMLDKNNLNIGKAESNAFKFKEKVEGSRPRVTGIPSVGNNSDFLAILTFVLCSITTNEFLGINNDYYKKAAAQVVETFYHLIHHHNITGGTKKWKDLVTYTTLLAEGRKPDPLPWVATERDPEPPVPTKLSELTPLVRVILSRHEGWEKFYQAFLTILSIPRLSMEMPELDLASVIEPFKGDKQKFLEFTRNFTEFVDKWSILDNPGDLKPEGYPVRPRMRMTSGPNGLTTLGSSVEEAAALIKEPTISKSFELFCTHTGNRSFYDYVKAIGDTYTKDLDTVNLGRLALVPDMLNKHRLVAMVDYWTNILFSPLEEKCRYLLSRRLHLTDFLRNHADGAETVRNRKGLAWSIDLKSWTDRFPIRLQQVIVERLLGGNNLGQHWSTLLRGREYYVPSLKKGVRYSVGQPMGSKSSFAVASLTHHAFIHYCYSLVHREKRSLGLWESYAIVGDDLVIFLEPLAREVRKYYEICGVEIQDSKSKIPVGENVFKEFCSRTSINNTDVSRIPPGVISNASVNWRDIPNLLIEMRKRGVVPLVDSLQNVPYLSKERVGGSYLERLKELCQLPLMGTDLSSVFPGFTINCKYSVEHINACVNSLMVIRAWEKWNSVEDKMINLMPVYHKSKEKYLTKKKMDEQEGHLINIKPSPMYAQESVFTHKCEIWELACTERLRVKGWEFTELPHPASLAAAEWLERSRKAQATMCTLADDLEKVDIKFNSPFEVLRYYFKETGKLIAAILPKESDDLIPTAGNLGTEFLRTQVSLYSKVLTNLKSEDKLMDYVAEDGRKFVLDLKIDRDSAEFKELNKSPLLPNIIKSYPPKYPKLYQFGLEGNLDALGMVINKLEAPLTVQIEPKVEDTAKLGTSMASLFKYMFKEIKSELKSQQTDKVKHD